jgi:hypothetical protein
MADNARPRRRSARYGVGLARAMAVGLGMLLSACSAQQPSPEAGGSSTPSTAASPAATPTPAPAENGGEGQEAPAPNPIAWLLSLGPGAPAGPPEFQAYELVLNRDCASLAQRLGPDGDLQALSGEAVRLYEGLANACLAAFSGETGRWEAAETAFEALAPPVSCLDVAAYGLLGRLVTAHQTNPMGQFEAATDPASAAAPPCPSITVIEPNRGPSGTPVLVAGTNLDRVGEVILYFETSDGTQFESAVEYQAVSPEALTITVVDDTNVALWACVVVRGAPGWNGAGALFVIEDSPGAPPAQSGVPEPAPTAPCPPASSQ